METIHLQGIGKRKAKHAKDLQIGEIILWNYGETSVFKGFSKITDKQVIIITEVNGNNYERRLSKNRMIAIQ